MSTCPTTLHPWMDYWREMYFCPNVGRKTYEISGFNIRILKNYISDYPLDEITLPIVQKLFNDLKENGYAKDTIKKLSSYIFRAFDKAVYHGLINENPAVGTIIPKAPKKKVKALTQDQQQVLKVFCKSVDYGDYIEFLLLTGIRVGEFCKLRRPNYNPTDKTIFIEDSKTEDGIRIVPLLRRAVEIIEAQHKSDKDDFIFRNKHNNPITYSSMKKCYEKLRKLTGFEDFTNHVCRHSFATRLIEKGVNPKSTAALLGHKKVDFCLNVYTDIEKSQMVKDIYILENEPVINSAGDELEQECLTILKKLQALNNGKIPTSVAKAVLAG